MFLKCIRLSRAVPVTSAALATLLMVSLQAQAPATATPPAQSAADANLPTAREILDRHVKAIGGREAVLSHKSAHATGTFSVPSSGMVGTIETFGASNPDRILVRISIPGLGEMANGFDGSHGWAMTPMTGPMLQQGKELDQTKIDADFYSELRDPKKYTEHQDGGEDRLRGTGRATRSAWCGPTATRTSSSTTSQNGLRAGASRRASPRWARSPRRASKGTTRSSATCSRPRRWCRR